MGSPLKCVLLGDKWCGKSKVAIRLTHGCWCQHPDQSLIEFRRATFSVDDERLEFHLWDSRNSISSRFADVVLLAFDLSSQVTIPFWYEEIKQHASSNTIVILLGCKSDIAYREEKLQALETAKQLGLPLLFCSSRTSENIHSILPFIYKVYKSKET